MSAESAPRAPALSGVRVLDMTRFIAGPYCTMLLADAGAEVVKVEPLAGEETRALPPLLGAEEPGCVSGYFLRYNRGKKSVCVDLDSCRGRDVLAHLVRSADVLVENFRPDVLERLGFGWDTLATINNRLLYCTITGFGYSSSPLRSRPAFTPSVEALSGAAVYTTRDAPPRLAGYPVGDIFPASLAVAAVAMGLYRRERDGRGSRIDIAMYDAMIAMNERALALTASGREFLPGIAADTGSAPAGIFAANDGFVSIAVVGEVMWERFCRAIDRSDWIADERLSSGTRRSEHHDALLLPGIQRWLTTLSRAEAVATLTKAGVAAAEVWLPSEALDAEQTRARGMVVEVGIRGRPRARTAATPIRFAGEPVAKSAPAPEPGQHTEEVLRDWAGLSASEIVDLLDEGIIATTGG